MTLSQVGKQKLADLQLIHATKTELADKLGVSLQTMRNWEKDGDMLVTMLQKIHNMHDDNIALIEKVKKLKG